MTEPRLQPSGIPGRRGGRSLNSRVIQVAAFALAFILVAGLVVTSSRAAFVAQNDNTANTVSSASVDLTDNDADSAMFVGVTGLVPGTVEERCIQVTYTGNVDPTEVKLYIAGPLAAGDLSDYLNLTIDVGAATGQAFRSCNLFSATATLYSGDLLDFATAHPDYATTPVATTWDPSATGESRTFRFRISVQDVPAAESKSTTFGFSWETRTS
jgi:hypothetical protein